MFDQIPLLLAQEDGMPVEDGATSLTQQTTTTQTPGTPGTPSLPPAARNTGSDWTLPIMMIALFAIMFIVMTGGQRREKKKRAAMLAALSKGDKVQTVGGIIGTVIEVRESDVLVKVDESNNTRIKFSRMAIQSVLQDKEE